MCKFKIGDKVEFREDPHYCGVVTRLETDEIGIRVYHKTPWGNTMFSYEEELDLVKGKFKYTPKEYIKVELDSNLDPKWETATGRGGKKVSSEGVLSFLNKGANIAESSFSIVDNIVGAIKWSMIPIGLIAIYFIIQSLGVGYNQVKEDLPKVMEATKYAVDTTVIVVGNTIDSTTKQVEETFEYMQTDSFESDVDTFKSNIKKVWNNLW